MLKHLFYTYFQHFDIFLKLLANSIPLTNGISKIYNSSRNNAYKVSTINRLIMRMKNKNKYSMSKISFSTLWYSPIFFEILKYTLNKFNISFIAKLRIKLQIILCQEMNPIEPYQLSGVAEIIAGMSNSFPSDGQIKHCVKNASYINKKKYYQHK